MRNVLDKRCGINKKTHFLFNYFFPKFVPYEMISKNMVEFEGPQIWLIRVLFWISKTIPIYTHVRALTRTDMYIIVIAFAR